MYWRRITIIFHLLIIDKYTILIKNTNSPDIKCDLVIKSNVYTIDQAKKIIKVNSEHSLETIKSNLYSSCGEIRIFNDKVTISDNSNIVLIHEISNININNSYNVTNYISFDKFKEIFFKLPYMSDLFRVCFSYLSINENTEKI